MTAKKQEKEKKLLPKEVKAIGLRLKQIRKDRGFTSAESYAYHYGINRSQYGKYEAGSEDFRVTSFIKILEKIDVKLTTFFNGKFDELLSETKIAGN